MEVISICDSDGSLKPLRFRYEDNNHDKHIIRNIKVIDFKELNYVGIQVYAFTCTAPVSYGEIKFELRYHIKEHRWILFRMIN